MADDPDQLPDAAGLSDLAGKIADEQLQPDRLQKQAQHARNIGLEQQKDLDRYAWQAGLEWFIEEAARRMINATSVPESVLSPLARGAIDSLLADGPPTGRAGTDAGDRLLRKVSGGAEAITPGTGGAAAYLTLFLNESIEAWFRAVIVEFITEYMPKVAGIGGGIETVQRLQDVIEGALGGSRMVRRVLQPFISATAITPAQWHVNKRYRPELLSPTDAARQFLRGRWTREQFEEELARQGWSTDRIEALLNAQRKFFAAGDVRQFVTRGHWTHDQGLAHLQEQGYTQEEAEHALRLEGLRRFESLEAQEGNAIVTAYANREIDEREFLDLMRTFVQNETERNLLTELAGVRRRLNVRQLSSTDERRLAIAGIRAPLDYRRALEREGYDAEAVAALDLELRAILADRRADAELKAQQVAARAAEEAAAAAAREARLAAIAAAKALPSLADIRRAYVRGHLPLERYIEAAETAHPGIAGGDLAALVAEAEADRAAYLESLERRRLAEIQEADAALSLNQLEQAVLRGQLTIEDYARDLRDRGYDDREVNLLAGVLRAALEDRQAAAARRAEAERRAAAGGVSLNAWERAVRLGLRTIDQYAAYLVSIDTPELARALILDLLRTQLQLDAEARAKREAADAAAAARGISLERRRRAVILGLRDLAYYERALADARLPLDDQRLELELLAVEAAEAAAARARRDEIAAELEARRAREEAERAAREAAGAPPGPIAELTLSQVERAVKLGLLAPDDLRAFALERGYAPADADLLVELATFQVPDLREADRRREEIREELAARRVSLEDLERAVLRGIRTLAEFEAELAARGYGEDDTALLSQLLAERIAVDVAGLRTKITAALAKREGAPPLEALTAAVIAGELAPSDALAILEGAGVAPDTALVYVRLVLTRGAEG
jgi:hypothetical protein